MQHQQHLPASEEAADDSQDDLATYMHLRLLVDTLDPPTSGNLVTCCGENGSDVPILPGAFLTQATTEPYH